MVLFLGAILLAGCKESPAELKSRAETGNLDAVVQLARAYQSGNYEDQPMPYWPEEAFRLYRLAAEQGDPRGMRGLGWCFLEGNGTPAARMNGIFWIFRGYREAYRDRKKTMQNLQAEAAQGSAKSQYRLALIYRDGQGVDPDPVLAIDLLNQSAKAGYADSAKCLSLLRNELAKFHQTEARAKQGDAAAMVRYAEYFSGNSFQSFKVKPDPAKVAEYLEKSSSKSPEGKLALARYLLRHDFSSSDRARKLCREASRAGYQPAMEFVAGLQEDAKTEDGHDLFSPQESFETCWRLAEAEMRDAQVLLAKKYLEGRGTPRAPAKAIPWLKRAATPKENESGLIGVFLGGLFGPDRGDAEAQFLLGCCFRDGLGVGKNTSEAMKWFLLSSKNGRADAQAAMAALKLAQN